MRALRRAGVAFILAAATARAAFSDSPAETSAHGTVGPARPDHSWNAVFDRHDGWTGADVAGTVALGDGRMLWLFGDTWIGSIRSGKRLPGATMVNNSVAVHWTDQAATWKAPDPDAVRFYWGANNAEARPTAWVVPLQKAGGRPSTPESREWLWPTGGGLAVEGPAQSRRVFLFFFRVQTNPRGKGVWGFTVVGAVLGVIDNPSEPIDRWKVRLLNIPHSIPTKEPVAGPAEAEITWGMTACLAPGVNLGKSHDALIYGVRRTGRVINSLVLARAPAAAIDHFDEWTFYAGKNSLSQVPTDSAPLANGMVSEFSVERLNVEGRSIWILVQSEPFLGKRILLRTAAEPQGPWSSPRTVATVAEVEHNRSYFTYAAKGHSHLSQPAELLITYLVNSNHFVDLMSDTRIYRPKFLRLSTSFLSSR